MNDTQPIRFYMLMLSVFLLAMVAGTLYFLMGMGQSTYLLSDGVRVTTRYLDKPRYDMNFQGLIFSLSFLLAGALLLLMIILPDERRNGYRPREAPPQPRRRATAAEPAQPAAPSAAPQPAAQPAAEPQPAATAQQTSPLSIESGEGDTVEPPPEAGPIDAEVTRQARADSGVSVEEEVLQSAASADDLPAVDFGDSRFEDAGDEDVVYGEGRITEDAIWEFVQQYPDSAVKFLYRKALDNKSLSPTEEDIYRNWETRGMTRAKVREIVLDVMRWQSLPDNFPHEIWRELRDQIYEISTSTR